MRQKLAALLLLLLPLWLSGCLVATDGGEDIIIEEEPVPLGVTVFEDIFQDDTDGLAGQEDAEAYQERLTAYRTATEHYQNMESLESQQVNEVYQEVIGALDSLLHTRASTELEGDALMAEAAAAGGFRIQTSATFSVENAHFRLVKLENIAAMFQAGALQTIHLQFWNDLVVKSVAVAEIATTAETAGVFVDFGVSKTEQTAMIVERRYNYVEGKSEYYQVTTIRLAEGDTEIYFPLEAETVATEHWQASHYNHVLTSQQNRPVQCLRIESVNPNAQTYGFTIAYITNYRQILVNHVKRTEEKIHLNMVNGMYQLVE